jgi:hypothetical protein
MPTLLLSFKKANGGLILHGFLAKTDAAAEEMKAAHAEICPQYGPAVKADEVFDNVIDIPEIPAFDADSIDDWVAEMFVIEDDEDLDEEDGDDPEDVEEEEETER